MKKAEAYWPLILLLAIIKFLLPLFLQSPVYELQRDEFLYYQQGQHLALGYLENPPLLSYLGQISSWFGDHAAWIKIWPCLFGAATLVVTCLVAAELGGGLFAQFIAGLGIITGAFMRVHFLYQPNILDIFFWTLALYFLLLYVTRQQDKYLYGIAISLAFGWWSKYSVLFIAAAIILGILLSPHRKLLLKRKAWAAGLIALLLILPNVLWQYTHNWPLVHHMNELKETQLRYLNKADFIKEQFLLLFPVLFVWITGLIWLIRKKQYQIFGLIYLLVIALLMFGSGKGYYALGVYPLLLAAGGAAMERWSAGRQWLRYSITALIIALSIPLIPMLLPVWKPDKLAGFYQKMGMEKIGLLKWEDQQNHPLPQDFADMLGWRELAEKTESAFIKSLPDDVRDNTIIYCRHYGQAGSLKFYGRSSSFRERVFTDNGSFLLWIPGRLDFKHILFVGRRFPDKDDEVFQHFRSYTLLDSVTNPFSRQLGDKIILFENIDSSGLRLAKDGLNKMKNQFRR